ncbi:coiled-coil domain-containing protein 87 [Danio aesculapii]|uniref:coiled-coil domain-containing protein 87 n=1 Tax=Danio aesculapii TaxID=1142201 RepID=UPI0024BF6E2D|nr:coiled-coil domain-containing protein 87 [Danio aesculapii]
MDIGAGRMTDRSKEVMLESSVNKNNKCIPRSLTQLCKQLEDRIMQISQHYSICDEDRHSLTAVLSSELALNWQDLKSRPVDSTLSRDERVQLHRQTFSEVLHICEQLFLRYLHLAETLRRRGVFSDCANRRRLAAQLAVDCTSLLNIRSIRCRIVTGIKAMRSTVIQQKALHTEMCTQEKTVEDDLREVCYVVKIEMIQDKIGELDLQRVYDLLPCNMEQISNKTDKQCSTASICSILKQEQDQSPNQNRSVRLKGCHSMPNLRRESLLEELDIKLLRRPSSPLLLLSTDSPSSLEKHMSPGEDLKRLLQESDNEDDSNCEADLFPLIEALTFFNSSRLQKLKKRLLKMKEEVKEKKKRKAVEKPLHAQGDVISVAFTPQTIMRTAAVRVPDWVFPETLKLRMCPPVYNELTEEIDSASVLQMDQNLVEQKLEMSKVYEELFRNISTKYFNFEEDPSIEPSLTNPTCLISKRTIYDKLINQSLRRPNPYNISHRERMERNVNKKRPEDVTTRAYRAWFQWWKCQLSLDDYLDYISTQDSDYLSVLFHLYDSDDGDDEEAERHKLDQQQKEERRRKQQERFDSLRRRKQEFVPGFWNINTIEMGGLGREPKVDERKFEEDVDGEGPASALQDTEQLQLRLEKVWNALHLPEGQRLDMAIKYSSYEHRDHLQEAISAWEQATCLIHKRELLLSRLEDFEREASDPNRFFQPGYPGSSMARMEEATQREKLTSQISVVDEQLLKIIGQITTRFHDNISYKGRPYREKMRWDRTEMLYWLQQERRVQSLEMFLEGQTALPVRLPPLSQSQELYSGKHQNLLEQPTSDCERSGRLLQHCEL